MRTLIFSLLLICCFQSAKAEEIHPHNWSGLYLSGVVGYGTGNLEWSDTSTVAVPFFGVPGTQVRHWPSGFVYGGSVGYNWQVENIVLSLEAGLNGSINDNGVYFSGGLPFNNSAKLSSILTFGGRFGLAHEKSLYFLQSGLAYADVDLYHQTPLGLADTSKTHKGFYIGGGIDWALSNNWVIGIDYKHFGFKDNIHTGATAFGTSGVLIHDLYLDSITMRLTYKF